MSTDERAEEGFLILADISGFTAFVTGTELEHGAEITGVLLEVVMHRLAPPLEIQELEGEAFLAFKDEQRRLAADDGCSCRACRGIDGLDLKFVTHHGRFIRQVVGGRSRVAGPDVILVHRLLKNSVDAAAYLLLTAAALERIGGGAITGGMRRHLVSYPHLGEVHCFVADLESPELARAG